MAIQLTQCDNCGEELGVALGGTAVLPVHWNDVQQCSTSSFYNQMMATPVYPKKYTVIMYDGIGPMSGMPERPRNANQASTVAEAKAMFRVWLDKSGNDYERAEGHSAPWMDVILTESWDGISYGDYPMAYRLYRGKRGGLVKDYV